MNDLYKGNMIPMNDTMSTQSPTLDGLQLAMVYTPVQHFQRLYSPEDALKRGTLFEELDKPLWEGER